MKDIEKKVRTNRINIECKKDIEKKFRTNGMIKEKKIFKGSLGKVRLLKKVRKIPKRRLEQVG